MGITLGRLRYAPVLVRTALFVDTASVCPFVLVKVFFYPLCPWSCVLRFVNRGHLCYFLCLRCARKMGLDTARTSTRDDWFLATREIVEALPV